jgi:hypothetical protein
VGLVLTVDQGLLYRRLARRGVTEGTFTVIGTVLMAVGLTGLGALTAFATMYGTDTSRLPQTVTLVQVEIPLLWKVIFTGFLLCTLAIAVTGFSFVTPSVQALISRRSDPHKQGEILGVNQSANAMSRILGPFLGMSLYPLQANHVLPYALGVSLLVVVLLLIPRVRQA